jgi:hypothetical protein
MKRNSVSLALACTLVLLLGSASLSQADQIVITAGLLQMDGGSGFGSVELAGNRGFTLSSIVNIFGGSFSPLEQCPCAPGSTVSLNATWSGSDLLGAATLDGQSYILGIGDTDASAFVEFTGSVVLPALLGDSASVSAPFLFGGFFDLPEFQQQEALRGRGTATPNLRRSESDWTYSSARYEFEPIPEPGTMFLLGGGLAGLVARRLKRRRTG